VQFCVICYISMFTRYE